MTGGLWCKFIISEDHIKENPDPEVLGPGLCRPSGRVVKADPHIQMLIAEASIKECKLRLSRQSRLARASLDQKLRTQTASFSPTLLPYHKANQSKQGSRRKADKPTHSRSSRPQTLFAGKSFIFNEKPRIAGANPGTRTGIEAEELGTARR